MPICDKIDGLQMKINDEKFGHQMNSICHRFIRAKKQNEQHRLRQYINWNWLTQLSGYIDEIRRNGPSKDVKIREQGEQWKYEKSR